MFLEADTGSSLKISLYKVLFSFFLDIPVYIFSAYVVMIMMFSSENRILYPCVHGLEFKLGSITAAMCIIMSLKSGAALTLSSIHHAIVVQEYHEPNFEISLYLPNNKILKNATLKLNLSTSHPKAWVARKVKKKFIANQSKTPPT